MRLDLLPTDLDGKMWRVVEEASELIKAIGKLGRFGAKPIDPKTGIQYDNVADIRTEMTDLRHSMDELEKCL